MVGEDNPDGGNSYQEFDAGSWTRTKDNMFFILESDKDSDGFGGTSTMVDMVFVPPEDFGASSYTLQQSTDGGAVWNDFLYYGNPLTTTDATYNNFSIPINQAGLLRLAITGGQYDGQYSNTADLFQVSSVNTKIMEDSFTSSFGVFTTTITLQTVPDYDPVDEQFTYQWYHLDPDDFEVFTAIPGATASTYTATADDNGYIIVCQAVEDTETTGCFINLSLNISMFW